jgi:hypothetical protein
MTSFADLLQARSRALARPEDAAARERYAALREDFERTHGRIVDGHWSQRYAAGIAICCRHLSFGRLQWSLHRSLDPLTDERPEFARPLRHVAGESARASSLLSGRAQRLAVSSLFARARHLMSALEA